MREVHLLPHFCNRNRVEPLVGARISDVIEMIVNAGASTALLFVSGWQPAEIPPIVITPEQSHIVWNSHAMLVVLLHFLVERPELGNFRHVWIHVIGDDFALVGHDPFQQIHVGRDVAPFHHGHVAIATHADGHDAFIVLVALGALRPELTENCGIGRVVPGSGAVPLPLLLRAQHRLVVRGPHHDAIFVGQLRVQRIILVESVVPHGRPKIVGF